MKIWTNDRSNNVHTQKAPLQYRATLHRTTRTTLASLLFGRYACLLCFLRPLISRKGLLATSWRRSFGLLLSRCGAAGSGCMTRGPIGASIFCDRLTIDGMLLRAMVGPTGVVFVLLALQTPNLLDSFNKGDVTAERRASRRFGVQLKALDEIYNIYKLLHRSAFINSAKFRQTCSHVYSFILTISLMFRNFCPNLTNFDEHFPEFQQICWKRSKSPRFSNFLRFRTENC